MTSTSFVRTLDAVGCGVRLARRSLRILVRRMPASPGIDVLHPRLEQRSIRGPAPSRRTPKLDPTGPPTDGEDREAHLSTERPPPRQEARLPGSHEHPGRPGRDPFASGQGPHAALRLIDRIRSRAEFDRLRRSGTRFRVGPLRCTYLPEPRSRPAVAYAIGRAAGSAVRRNRLRRRLRALVRGADLPPGLLLIAADPPTTGLTFDELAPLVAQLRRRMLPLSRTS